MAYLKFTIDSNVYNSREMVSVVVPDAAGLKPCTQLYPRNFKFPVLWLIHDAQGGYDDFWIKTQLEYAIRKQELIVVMPDIRGLKRQGTGSDADERYLAELMGIMGGLLPIIKRKEGNYIAGVGEGGNFALRNAVRLQCFGKACSLSGKLNRDMAIDSNIGMYVACGTEDERFGGNQEFVKYAKDHKCNITWKPSFDTTGWKYWDAGISGLIDWLEPVKPGSEETGSDGKN